MAKDAKCDFNVSNTGYPGSCITLTVFPVSTTDVSYGVDERNRFVCFSSPHHANEDADSIIMSDCPEDYGCFIPQVSSESLSVFMPAQVPLLEIIPFHTLPVHPMFCLICPLLFYQFPKLSVVVPCLIIIMSSLSHCGWGVIAVLSFTVFHCCQL